MARRESETLPKYLNRRSDTGAYRHQRRIPTSPENLVEFFPGCDKAGNIVEPLGTTDRKVAERRNQYATVYTTELLRRAQTQGESFTRDEIHAWFQHLVMLDKPPVWIRPPDERATMLALIVGEWRTEELDPYIHDPSPERDHWFHDYQEVLASIRRRESASGVESSLGESEWQEVAELGWEVFQQHLEARAAVRRKRRDFDESLIRDEDEAESAIAIEFIAGLAPGAKYRKPTPIVEVAKLKPIHRVTNPLLSDLVSEWAAKVGRGEKYTETEVRPCVNTFEEIVGKVGIIDLSKAHVRKYREALQRLPPHSEILKLGFKQGYKVSEVLSRLESVGNLSIRTLSVASINKMMTSVSTIMNHAVAEYGIDNNPFSKMSLKDRKSNIRKRIDPNSADLKLLFESPLYTGCSSKRSRHEPGDLIIRDSLFWIPLLALWTGGRLEELGQLRCADVKVTAGIHFISITTQDDESEVDHLKQLKNDASVRDVPIHPELVRCGFLDHVERQRAASCFLLFPDLKPNKYGRLTQALSTRYARYRVRIGFDDPRKPAHAFRHLFKSRCRDAGVPLDIQDDLMGHTGTGQGKDYGSGGIPMRLKAKWMNRITQDVDLSHLYTPANQASVRSMAKRARRA